MIFVGKPVEKFEITLLEDEYDLKDLREDRCPICIAPFEKGDCITQMPCCSIALDPRCLAEWAKTSSETSDHSSTCPYCRANFDPRSIIKLFPEAVTSTQESVGSYNRQLGAHHYEIPSEIIKANERHGTHLAKALEKIASVEWPAVSPARLQHKRAHFERLGKLNEVLSTDAYLENPAPAPRNTLVVGSLSEPIDAAVLRLDFTSIYCDEISANGFRDVFFVYAESTATIKDLAKAWLKVWVRGSVPRSSLDAWLDNVDFNEIPPLFYQRFDRTRWLPLDWETTIHRAGVTHSGQVSVLEEETAKTHMNPVWQQIWNMIEGKHRTLPLLQRMAHQIRSKMHVCENRHAQLEALLSKHEITDWVIQMLASEYKGQFEVLRGLRQAFFGEDTTDHFDSLREELATFDDNHAKLWNGPEEW